MRRGLEGCAVGYAVGFAAVGNSVGRSVVGDLVGILVGAMVVGILVGGFVGVPVGVVVIAVGSVKSGEAGIGMEIGDNVEDAKEGEVAAGNSVGMGDLSDGIKEGYEETVAVGISESILRVGDIDSTTLMISLGTALGIIDVCLRV